MLQKTFCSHTQKVTVTVEGCSFPLHIDQLYLYFIYTTVNTQSMDCSNAMTGMDKGGGGAREGLGKKCD